MERELQTDLGKLLGGYTAFAFWFIAQPHLADPITFSLGDRLSYLAVHQHGDLMRQQPDGYEHSTPAIIARLTGQERHTVATQLAMMSGRGWLIRIPLGPRSAAYRPNAHAERWARQPEHAATAA